MRKRVRKTLITGGAGFIGSEFVRQAVKRGYKVAVVDNVTYAGDINRIKEVFKKISFYKTDISRINELEKIVKRERPHSIVHFAAETHVDRSIQNAQPFIKTNIIGTQNLIDLARKYNIKRFVHMSTDEVYGDHKTGRFKESDPIRPNNPYSASKASAELLVRAAIHTFNFPGLIVRPANNYGPWQYPEKFVPVILLKALKNQKVPVYGKGQQVREWLYVSDCVDGIFIILNKGKIGKIYNIGSYHEQKNINTAKSILKLLGKTDELIQFVKDRPGHDFRYSVNCTRLKKLGWRPKTNFKKGITTTIQWYIEHLDWLEKKLSHLHKYWAKIYIKK